MYEENRILTKIEQWVEKLPYNSVKIEIELPNQTLVLMKEKPQRKIGFDIESKTK